MSTTLVLVGVSAGLNMLVPSTCNPCPRHVPLSGNKYVDTLTLWDGQWYLEIAAYGYQYDPSRQSSVAFFPVYPALVEILHRSTRLSIHAAGLLLSHAFLIGAVALLVIYAKNRVANAPPQLVPYVVLACVLFPTSFFMRMAYTESLFLFVSLLAFVGMDRRWPLGVTAAIVGTATGTRSVGVALLLPFAHHVWQESGACGHACVRLLYLVPLALWGLLEYIAFQWWVFGDPVAFLNTQEFWRLRPPVEFSESFFALLCGAPIWAVFTSSMPGYWADIDRGVPFFLSYQLANPTLFVLAIVLVLFGATNKWLSCREVTFAALLLGIPYAMAGYRFCMASQGRYVCVVFPIYLVLGRLLSRIPAVASIGILGLFAVYLTLFSAMLAAGYLTV